MVKAMKNEENEKETKKVQVIDVQEIWSRVLNSKYEDLVIFLYQPTDPSSLGIIRFLFGLLMLIDLSEERGGSEIDLRWGDPQDCHFPLFSVLTNPGYTVISILYFIMWIGCCGIMLGYKFRISTLLFGIPYWYIILLDKSFWNNHSYLFGIVTILLMGSSANHFLSVDSYLDSSIRNTDVPYWNYFILKYQFFLLYFLAGLKKTDMEWLEGYSMTNLGEHWVFSPFRFLLSSNQIDYLIVHWFGFLLDLTIGFWMLIEFTRPVAMLFCSSFHLMNSRLFSIGMFPYVCLATMPLFCEETWPKKILTYFTKQKLSASPSKFCIYKKSKSENENLPTKPKWKHKIVVALLLSHCGLQVFLPYSHFITKGYNNWTNGLYGYSWDMMVHSWDTILVVVKIVDNDTGKEVFVNADAFTNNDRWSKHADMCIQYAQCLKNNLETSNNDLSSPISSMSSNISIFVDVWCSLNKRFQQRMFNPKYDLLKANWSPFKSVEWLLPVLNKYNDFRKMINDISHEVYSWSNRSDVLFIADFPGLYLENYISQDLENVTLTVLEGVVAYEVEDEHTRQSTGFKLIKGQSIPIEVEMFHKVHVLSETPSCYMYTFSRKEQLTEHNESVENKWVMYSPFPLVEDIYGRWERISNLSSPISSMSSNISIFVDVWCSLNKRFQQRMFNPKYDLLKANWSPFKSVEWLLPVLNKYNDFRKMINDISHEVYSWSNRSDVLFIADFPGLYLENYISQDLENVTLTVLEGVVAYEVEDEHTRQSTGFKLIKGQSIPIEVEMFHKVHVLSETPSCYMYTFSRKEQLTEHNESVENKWVMYSPFPLVEDIYGRWERISSMWKHITKSILYLFFG